MISSMIEPVSPAVISKAVEFLRLGQLVAIPTETVYGLAADASNPQAISRLYTAKGRPTNHPVIVHLHCAEQAAQWARDIPASFYDFARAFWPGPLTIVLRRAARVLDQVTGGQDTVALRMPSHPVARRLLEEFRGGLAAPSANKFGRLSPTTAEAVIHEFGNEISLVLDGGPCEVGIESTILDLFSPTPRILRPGVILAEELEAATGIAVSPQILPPSAADVRVPGSLPAHYAPSTPLLLLPFDALTKRLQAGLDRGDSVAVLSFQAPPGQLPGTTWVQASAAAREYARNLYAELRRLDELKVSYILVQEPPATPEWSGVLDRLKRAATTDRN